MADERHVVWVPQRDITAYELSQAMTILIALETNHYFVETKVTEALPDAVRRHFIFQEGKP